MNRDVRTALLVVLILLLGGAGGVVIFPDGENTPQRPSEAPGGDTQAPGALPTGSPSESVLRDEVPGTGAVLRPVLPREKVAAGPSLPTGGSQNYNCKRDFSGNVFSSRNGAKPRLFVWHYTVSPNVKGWGDILGVQGYFKRSRVGSSHFIVDFEGNCLQMVPIAEKSWTQGALNPIAISVEIIATGSETRAQWLDSPLIKRGILAELTRDQSRANGLAVRWFDPVGCSPTGTGTTDHDHLECNDHTDVRGMPVDVVTAQLQNGPDALPVRELTRCRRLEKYRGWVRQGRSVSATARQAAQQRKRILKRRGFRCGRSGLVRA